MMAIANKAPAVANMSESATTDAVDVSESTFLPLIFWKEKPATSVVGKVVGTSFRVNCVVFSIGVVCTSVVVSSGSTTVVFTMAKK